MASMKVQCRTCRKRFSGEESKIAAIKACPKCKQAGSWWVVLDDHTVQPADGGKDTASSSPPVSGPPASPLVSSTPYGEQREAEKAPRSRLPVILIPVVALVFLGLVGSGIWWLTSDDATPDTDSASEYTDEQRVAIEELLKEMKALHSRLDVGVSFNDYVGYLGDIKVKLDAAKDACGENAPWALTKLQRAFNDHEFAKMVWENSGTWVLPTFHSTLKSTYGVSDAQARIWRTDALTAVWLKAEERINEAEALLDK